MFHYNETVFRPPAEFASAIIQVTYGCSWNKCAFVRCTNQKKFTIRKVDDIKQEIQILSRYYSGVKKVFLADGNAMVLSTSKLLEVISEINKQFGKLQRISSYALPKDILSKSYEELGELRANGLKLLYVGIESGDNELLDILNKGESYQSTIKAHKAGIDTSVMIINGLGGTKYSEQHITNSARLVNEINPKFLSTLNLSFPYGIEHFNARFKGEFVPLTVAEILEEMKLFISLLNIDGSIFRSDHVSNQAVLKGVLSRDKEVLIQQIDEVLQLTSKDVYPSPSLML